MKSLIAEVQIERLKKAEEPKKTLDFSSLEVKIDREQKKADELRLI